jgi:hypothetical protein
MVQVLAIYRISTNEVSKLQMNSVDLNYPLTPVSGINNAFWRFWL